MPSASLIKEFEKLIGKENVFTSEADRQSYAYDSAVLPPVTPGLVLRPTHAEHIGMLLRRCYDEGLPMTIRGAGTNLSGGTVPDSPRTVVIVTTALNRILEINEEDLYAVVEPGVVTAARAAGPTTPKIGRSFSAFSSVRALADTVPQATTTAFRSKERRKLTSCRA